MQTRQAESLARHDLEHQRLTIDELSRKIADLEVRHRNDLDARRKMVQEKEEMEVSAKRAENSHSDEVRRLRRELASESERYKQLVSDKEQVIMRFLCASVHFSSSCADQTKKWLPTEQRPAQPRNGSRPWSSVRTRQGCSRPSIRTQEPRT